MQDLIKNLRALAELNHACGPIEGMIEWKAADAIELLSASKPAVPEGWKLVMVERSYDMRAKAIIAFNTTEQSGKDRDDALHAAWQAMLAACPAAPLTDNEEDAYVIKRLSTVLAEVAGALMDKDADMSGADVLAKLPEAAQTLKLEVELYRANAAAPAQSGEPVALRLQTSSGIEPEQAAVALGEQEARAIRLLEIAEPILEAAALNKAVTISAGDLLRQIRVFLPRAASSVAPASAAGDQEVGS